MPILTTEHLTRRFGELTAVDALRGLMIVGGISNYGMGLDLLVLFAGMIALVIIGARLYPRVVV